MVIEEADWLKSMTGHAIREINTTLALRGACCRFKSKPIKSNRAHFKPLPFKLFSKTLSYTFVPPKNSLPIQITFWEMHAKNCR